MPDLVVRNARLPDEVGSPPLVDIGFRSGYIAVIEPNIQSEAPAYDSEDRLCCAGRIETHIHLDKSRIIVNRPAPDASIGAEN